MALQARAGYIRTGPGRDRTMRTEEEAVLAQLRVRWPDLRAWLASANIQYITVLDSDPDVFVRKLDAAVEAHPAARVLAVQVLRRSWLRRYYVAILLILPPVVESPDELVFDFGPVSEQQGG